MQKNDVTQTSAFRSSEEVICQKNTLHKLNAVNAAAITGYNILKQSIDARGKQAWIQFIG